MALISSSDLLLVTDNMGAVRRLLRSVLGDAANVDSPTLGTCQSAMDKMLTTIVANSDDYDQQQDLAQTFYNARAAADIESVQSSILRTAIQALSDHCNQQGSTVDSTIIDLSTYLTYLNTTAHTAMVVPEFADAWYGIFNSRLPAAGVMTPCISPVYDSTVSANGMGSRAVGGSFTDGDAVNRTLYSCPLAILEVTANFTTGTAAPAFSVAGTDNTGVGTTTWTVTAGTTNPASAITPTITPAITDVELRQTVAFSSATGIVPGSVMTVDSGLTNQEVIIVEAVSGTDITAVFRKTHLAGCTVTGKYSMSLTPSVALRRLANASGLTITTAGHTTGTVRIIGPQNRVCK